MSILYSALTVAVSIAALIGFTFLLPIGQLPANVSESITTIISYITPWGFFIDFGTFFAVMAIVLTAEIWIFVIKLLFWIYRTVFNKGS